MVNILHQGMIGAIKGELQEYTYDKIKDEKKHSFNGEVNWLGITDKYWLAAFVPDQLESYIANYNFAIKQGKDKYQSDFITNEKLIEGGGSFELTHQLFAGPKKVDLLDKYEEKYNIKLFDRAIDFGWFYILTKPIFNAMNYFYSYVGNFGISIMIVTILIKLAMFTLANKSYRSMKKMKKLQPEMERLKQLYADDKARLNQEVMLLYKKEKINPVSGCLPLLVQIPVFFSIYKVLYVTIEMRHAPFFGWIQDLSAPDPTTIFNLFGLLPFTPPSFLMLGVWPLFMALTMFLQQRMSPQPTDPVQAQVMKFMPLMFLFMFSGFPAGLLIYWSWNNILSIVQQFYINKLDNNGS
jgi:YidC/Oxa1 family membrane protein insertase